MSATVKWETSNYNQIGTYTVSVTAKVTTNKLVFVDPWTVPVDYTITCSFNVVLKSVCDKSIETGITLGGTPPNPVTYNLGASQDQISISYYTVLNSV